MSPAKRISIAVAYLTAGYAFIFVARPVVDFLRERNFLRAVVVVICGAAIYLVYRMILRTVRGDRPFGLKLTAAVGGFYAILLYLVERPEERMHFVQYGLLSPILLFALGPYLRAKVALHSIAAYLLSASFGVIDECLQLVAPGRVFEWRDVQMNVAAATLGTLFSLMVLIAAAKRQANVAPSG